MPNCSRIGSLWSMAELSGAAAGVGGAGRAAARSGPSWAAPNSKALWCEVDAGRPARGFDAVACEDWECEGWACEGCGRAPPAGFAAPAASFLPPGIWSHDKTLKDRSDVEQAKALVKASGYDGSELTMFVAIGGTRKVAGELLQADFAKIGVKVVVRMMELGELFKRSGQGEHDIVMLAWYGDNEFKGKILVHFEVSNKSPR